MSGLLSHGKQKIKIKEPCRKGSHDWIITKWQTKGSMQKAIEVSCRYCLLSVDYVERDFLASLALKAQQDIPPPPSAN